MSKNILVDAYNLTKILTSIRKYRKRATSIDMLIDVALISAILGSIINVGVTPLRCHFQHYFFALNCQVKCNSTE